MERARTLIAEPSLVRNSRRKIHLVVPQVLHGRGDQREVLEKLDGDVFVDRFRFASSSAISSMLRQNFAIQAVPSDCSRTSPGRITERSTGQFVEP